MQSVDCCVMEFSSGGELLRFWQQEDRESDTISAFDMGIVLSNLLNNAIEACEKLEQENRYISLVLKRKNRFLLVEVENSFDGELEWREGETVPATKKQDAHSREDVVCRKRC